jgi:metal-dependent hydrolase (beta-lactamase superfamily II)
MYYYDENSCLKNVGKSIFIFQIENNMLFSKHHFSLYIEINEIKILFDTGKNEDFNYSSFYYKYL